MDVDRTRTQNTASRMVVRNANHAVNILTVINTHTYICIYTNKQILFMCSIFLLLYWRRNRFLLFGANWRYQGKPSCSRILSSIQTIRPSHRTRCFFTRWTLTMCSYISFSSTFQDYGTRRCQCPKNPNPYAKSFFRTLLSTNHSIGEIIYVSRVLTIDDEAVVSFYRPSLRSLTICGVTLS